MPKKTREDKIAAAARRMNLQHVTTKLISEDGEMIKYFKADLKKSFFLIIFIIALEITIYFGTMNNLGRIFKF